MTSEISNFNSAMITSLFLCSSLMAGLRIDLRPTPPVPPGGYAAGIDVRVDTFLVDTGNVQGAIALRGIFLDFNDSPPWGGAPGTLTYLDPDGAGPLFDNDFSWINPFAFCTFCNLPQTSWVYPLPTPNPFFQIVVPDNGEVQIGHLIVDVGTQGGILDAMNDDVADPNFGARVDFGFGGPGDPITTWRAFNGDITGGVLELPVVPEPATSILLVLAASALFINRKADR